MKKIFLSTLILFLQLIVHLYPLNIDIKIKDLTDNSEKDNLNFNAFNKIEEYGSSSQYLEVKFDGIDDENLWKLDIYTNEKNIPENSIFGGLLNQNDTNFLIPIAWQANFTSELPDVLPPDDNNSRWKWLKDENNKDLVETDEDESFSYASKIGYINVCKIYNNKVKLIDKEEIADKICIFFESVYNKIPLPGNYKGTVILDFYPVLDKLPPLLVHTPLRQIFGNNRSIIDVQVTDESKNIEVSVYYKFDSNNWQVCTQIITSSDKTKNFKFLFDKNKIKNAKKMFYYIESFDGYNITSLFSRENPQPIDILEELELSNVSEGEFEIPNNGIKRTSSKIVISKDALKNSVNIKIKIPEKNNIPNKEGFSNITPIESISFEPNDLSFYKPVKLVLSYCDEDNDGIVELPDGTETQISENDIGIFFYDGKSWQYLGGKVDKQSKTVTVLIDRLLLYAIFKVEDISDMMLRPKQKILTPARKDTSNDFAVFQGLVDNYEIVIYDITGKVVKNIYDNNPLGARWDGTDNYGKIVESGIYIYQITFRKNGIEKLISGTITVAK